MESTQTEPKGEGDANEEPKETIAGLQLLASEPSPKRRAPVVRKARATNSNGAIAQQEKRFARRTSEAAQAQLHAQVRPEVSTLIQVDATNQEVRRSGRTNDPPSAHPEPQRIMPQQGPAVGPPIGRAPGPVSKHGPPVMMFGRRSSPAPAVPLDRFRGGKGKIACSWVPPPGHRPCHRSFTRRADLERHIATVHQMLNVACMQCGATFSRQDALTRHQRDSCAVLFNANAPTH